MARKPIGDRPLTKTEIMRRYRARRKTKTLQERLAQLDLSQLPSDVQAMMRHATPEAVHWLYHWMLRWERPGSE